MNSLTDQQLLRDYAGHRSEAAFAELVRRHVDFVYSAALRMVRDGHLAKDVSQSVFVALARNARQLTNLRVLSGWLHRTEQNLAANAIRSNVRRHAREQEAAAMNELSATEPNADWENIAPHLDAALGQLTEADRDALLLRYFERKSAREMAQTLGTSEDAAQKRVSRAVERLREFFAERGVTVGASGLSVVIAANAVQAAPVGLAIAISTAAALAGATIAATATVTVTKAIAMTTLQKTSIAAIIVAGVATPWIVQHQDQVDLREENQSLRQQVDHLARVMAENEQLSKRLADQRLADAKGLPAPSLPAPPMSAAVPTAEPPLQDLQFSKVAAWFLRSKKQPQVFTGQVESYLNENGRSAASLLASSRVTKDQALLQEAMDKYPDDPQVKFAAVFWKDASPEERRQSLEAFKQSAPDNALASYLAAREFFKSGQIDQAVQELSDASSKQQFQDYFMDFSQNEEEAWSAAGYSTAEAKAFSGWSLGYPHLGALEQLSRDMVSLADSYRQAGDQASAQTILQMAVNLGQRLDGSAGQPLPSRNVSIAIESNALRAMDPASPYGGAGQTVNDRLNELSQQRGVMEQLEQRGDEVGFSGRVSDPDWIIYKDRWRAFGEKSALQWLVGKVRPGVIQELARRDLRKGRGIARFFKTSTV